MNNNNLTTIFLIRHGQSTFNAGTFVGKGDSNLTEIGVYQTKDLAKNLQSIHFDAIFSSDYIRAKRTAEIIALERNLVVKTTTLIRERSFGQAWEQEREKIRAEMIAILKTLSEHEKMKYRHTPDMESAEEGAIRLITFLREIAVAQAGKTVAVVAHGNLMRSFLVHLGWAKFDELPAGSVENTGYIKLESDGVNFFVKDTYKVNKVSILSTIIR